MTRTKLLVLDRLRPGIVRVGEEDCVGMRLRGDFSRYTARHEGQELFWEGHYICMHNVSVSWLCYETPFCSPLLQLNDSRCSSMLLRFYSHYNLGKCLSLHVRDDTLFPLVPYLLQVYVVVEGILQLPRPIILEVPVVVVDRHPVAADCSDPSDMTVAFVPLRDGSDIGRLVDRNASGTSACLSH